MYSGSEVRSQCSVFANLQRTPGRNRVPGTLIEQSITSDFSAAFDEIGDVQIGCGDLFENSVVDEFNDCAVSRKGCVPQKPDEGRFPIPGPEALVPQFDTTKFTGTWYITSGLNKTFDTFDCQKHDFTAEPTKLTGEHTYTSFDL